MGILDEKKEAEPPPLSLRQYLPVALVVCLGFVLSVISFNVIRGRDQARLEAKLSRLINSLVVAIERGIDRHLEPLRATSGLFYASKEVERPEFRAFARQVLTPNLAVQALEWVPLVGGSERVAYREAARRDGLSDFLFTERSAQGQFVRAPRRSEYYPVYYVEPYKGNEDALGFDLASDPTRLKALEEARDRGEMVATPRTTLVQASGVIPGFLVVQPIYRKGSSTDTLQERRKNIMGFTIGVFRIGDVVEASFKEANIEGFDFHLFDETGQAGQRRLYDRYETVNEKGQPYRTHDEEEIAAAIRSGADRIHKMRVGGRKWAFIFHPTEELLATEGPWRAWGILVGGLLITALLGLYLVDTFRRGDKMERLASELSVTNLALHRVNRALTAISRFNKALVRAEEEESLVLETCRVISDVAGYRMAWVGYAEQDEDKSVRPVAQWGFEAGYLDTLNISWADVDKGQGPSGRAIRTGAPTVVRNIQTDPDYRLWRDEATMRGYASTIALPLSDGERVFGVLRVYASEPDAFDEDEVELLKELAADLQYGILALRTRAKKRQAEEQLRKLSLAVEQSPSTVLITDPEGAIEYVNPKFTQVTGYSLEEAVGQKPSILKSGQMPPEIYEDLWRTITTGKEWRGELLNKKRNGQLYWDFVSISSIKDERGKISHYIAVKENITERKRMEGELRESEELHRLTLSNISDAVFITDDTGTFTYICPNVDMIFGHSHEEVQDFGNIAALLGETLTDNTRLKSVGEVPNIEREITDKFGNGHQLLVNVKSVSIKGGTVLYTCRDITERKRAEEEIRKANEELKEAYETLQRAQATAIASEKLASLGRLTAGVSHEIRNPLNVIAMSVYMMLQEPDINPERAGDLEDIMGQVRRIEKITDDLLYVARHRSQERRTVDLNYETDRIFRLLERELRLQNVHVELKLQDGLTQVSADQDQLQQVIFNLLSNARDAMPEGGSLFLKTKVLASKGGDMVELRVEDTGPGIPTDILNKIFEPFFTTKPEGKGTGLGLAICHGIIEAHEGSLWAENMDEGGAAFVVRLPVETMEESSASKT